MVQKTEGLRALPVDRGWAWVVLFGAAVSGVLVSVIYSVGIFNVAFLDVYGKDKFTTSWIGSLSSSLIMLAGPFATYLSGKIGARLTVGLGAFIGTSGFVLSSFAASFTQLFIAYGVITGFGVGLCSLPCVIAIGNHFNKYRNLAYGIYNSSIGLGSIFFPPLVSVCMEHYGWRGAMLIVGGICSHFLLAAATLRPADTIDHDLASEDSEIDKKRHDSGHHSPAHSDSLTSVPTMDPLFIESSSNIPAKKKDSQRSQPNRGSVLLNSSMFSLDIMSQSAIGLGSLTTIRSTQKRINTGEQEVDPTLAIHSAIDIRSGSRMTPKVRKHESVYDINTKNKSIFNMTRFTQSYGMLPQSSKECSKPRNVDSPLVFHKKPPLQSDNPEILSLSTYSVNTRPDIKSYYNSQLFAVRRDSQFFDTELAEDEEQSSCGSWGEMFNLGLFGLCASQFLFCFGMSITYLHLPTYAISQGITVMQSSSLLSVIGLTNVICRFLVGAATNHPAIDDAAVYTITSLIAGICLSMARPMCAYFSTQLVFAGLFGFFGNGYVSVMGPLTIKYVGLQYLGPAYSLQMLLSGISYFAGPPLAGLMFDVTGSYENSFYSAGACYIAGGLAMLPAWIWGRRRGLHDLDLKVPDPEDEDVPPAAANT